MDLEIKDIKLKKDDEYFVAILEMSEEAEGNEENVYLRLTFGDIMITKICDNFFYALLALRVELESLNLQICCNGAAESVYPSPMFLSMGVARKAYKLTFGKQALMTDLVDIFDYDETLEFVSIELQEKYYEKWANSVRRSEAKGD